MYQEKLNIILMRDKGPRRNFSIGRRNFYILLLFFGCLPFLCAWLAAHCWFLWEDNQKMRASIESFETEYQAAEARAEKLENLETLLQEEKTPGRAIILKQLSQDDAEPGPRHEPEKPLAEVQQTNEEGPGHEEFPALDTGRVAVSNVQARALQNNRLRIGFDLRNPDNEQLLSGNASAVLITANGEKYNLRFTPSEAGAFRINRYKRTVLTSAVPRGISLVDAQVILEIKNSANEEIFRNIYAVMR